MNRMPHIMPTFKVLLLAAVCWVGGISGAEAIHEPTVKLPVMTWFHPVLEPGVADILLLCTVSEVVKVAPVYEKDYWKVTLKIDERLYVAKRYVGRMKDVTFIESGDFRERSKGERLLLFAGGEPYEGDDFLLPCWSGTNSDLGIVLYPPDHDDLGKNNHLLEQLRAAAAGKADPADFYEAFADFCPKGVAKKLIMDIRMQSLKNEEKAARPFKKK